MVSIKSEVEIDITNTTESILPNRNQDEEWEDVNKVVISDSWPTLEIHPGGIIKHADKDIDYIIPRNIVASHEINYPPCVSDEQKSPTEAVNIEEAFPLELYSCAKCSQNFKHLCSLVKHVRWHEVEQKYIKKSIVIPKTKTKKYTTAQKRGTNVKRRIQVKKSKRS